MFDFTFFRKMRVNEIKFKEAQGAHFTCPKCIVGLISNSIYNIMQSTASRALETCTKIPTMKTVLSSESQKLSL